MGLGVSVACEVIHPDRMARHDYVGGSDTIDMATLQLSEEIGHASNPGEWRTISSPHAPP